MIVLNSIQAQMRLEDYTKKFIPGQSDEVQINILLCFMKRIKTWFGMTTTDFVCSPTGGPRGSGLLSNKTILYFSSTCTDVAF